MKFFTELRNSYDWKGYLMEIANKVLLAAVSTAFTLWTISLILPGIDQFNASKPVFLDSILKTLPIVSAWILLAVSSISILSLIMVVFYNLWSRFRSRKVALILTFSTTSIFAASHLFQNAAGEILSSISLLCSLICLLWPQLPKPRKDYDDRLHRSFFANRITDLLIKKAPPLRRIAITGSWGEGKTHLLRLIDTGLKKKGRLSFNSHKIQTIWVNPWKASTQAEALLIFAAAFDKIHRIPSIRVIITRTVHWLKSASSLAPESKIGNLVLEAISSHYPDDSKLDLEQIDLTLEMRRIRLVVFVDDMERADPSAVRGILPVIDKLTELENCFFIFGIDRDRIEDAFIHLNKSSRLGVSIANKNNIEGFFEADRNKARNYVSGFLDKVMDLQLELPGCSEIELQKFAQSIIEKNGSTTPKLKKAFSSIKPYLPQNPRTCKKFLDLAAQAELFYFTDYADEDRDFTAVFLVLIGESEFPGYRKFLADDLSWASFSGLEFMDESEGTDSAGEERQGFVSRICAKLEIPQDMENQDFKKIKRLHSAIYERVGERSLFYSGNYESERWVTNDFMARRELTPSEMSAVSIDWYEDSSARSFDEIIEERFGAEAPSDLPSTIYQILTGEIDKYAKKMAELRHSDQIPSPKETENLPTILSFLSKLENHFSTRPLSEPEKVVIHYTERDADGINPVIFERFLDLIKAFPIPGDAVGGTLKIRNLRISAISAVLQRLDLESKGRFLSDLDIRSHNNFGMYDPDKRVISEINEVSERLKAQLAEIFVDRICYEELDPFVAPVRNDDYNPFIIYEPNRWLPRQGENAFKLEKIEALASLLKSNELLTDNIFKATKRYFLEPCFKPEDSDIRWILALNNLIENPAGKSYIKSFWSLALKDPNHEKREQLIGLRKQAYDAAQQATPVATESQMQNQLSPQQLRISAETIESCFPLEESQDPSIKQTDN